MNTDQAKLSAVIGRRRRGALFSAELIFVLPILIGIVLAITQFGLMWSAKQQLKSASQAACRVATLPAADAEQQETAVRQAARRAMSRKALVKTHRLKFKPGKHAGDLVEVEIRVPCRAASPDLFAFLGIGFGDRELVSVTRMRKE